MTGSNGGICKEEDDGKRMYCLAIHCSIVAIMNKSQQDGWLAHQQKDLSTEGKEKKNERRSRRYKAGLDQIAKTRQKLDYKICEID